MSPLLRHAWRSWKGSANSALLAACALAIGIGSATAIYTVAEAVLLKPLPYRDAGRFVAVYGAHRNEPQQKSFLAYKHLSELASKQRSFDVFGWFTYADFNLTFAGQPEHVTGLRVTPNLVNSLGVRLRLGRWFGDSAHEAGNTELAVISDRLWRKLGGASDIVGKSVQLEGRSYTITGVAPPWFRLPLADPAGAPSDRDLWIPVNRQFENAAPDKGSYFCYARRKPDVSFAQAESEMKQLAAQYAREHTGEHDVDSAKVESLRAVVSQGFRPTLLLLMAATGLLLLITCANVSGLLVTRAVMRARDTAIRLALGAARRQLLLQYFSEGLLVSLAGAALGIALSMVLVRLIVSLGSEIIAQAEEITVDSTALIFAIIVALAAGLVTSLAPMAQAMRTAPIEALNDGVRASAGFRSRRLSQVLVIGEIALTFTLLSVGALLVSQLNRLNRLNPGFDPQHLYTFRLTADPNEFGDVKKLVRYQAELLRTVQAVAGIASATLTNQLPADGCCMSTTIFAEGGEPGGSRAERVSFLPVAPRYFETLRLPLLAGRSLNGRDTKEHILRAVINEATARRYWPSRNAIGAFGHFNDPKRGDRFQVVGIVADTKNDQLDKPTVPEIYLSAAVVPPNPAYFLVRSKLPPSDFLRAIRNAISHANPAQPIYDFRPYEKVLENSLTLQRAASLLTSFFAGAALLLAGLGVYGVVAYSVRQRTIEIGTRMALGAASRDLWRLILGGGLKMAAGGLLAGAVAVIAATGILLHTSVVHEVKAWPFVYSTATIAALALVASVYPAWRATQLSPMVAIRNEPASMWHFVQQRIHHALESRVEGRPVPSQSAVLSGFMQASRDAASFREALTSALETLCREIGFRSALLYEKRSQAMLVAASFPQQPEEPATLPTHGLLLNRLRSYDAPLPLSEADLEVWYKWASEQKPEHVAEISVLQAAHARLAVPIKSRRDIAGLLLLGPADENRSYSLSERQLVAAAADQLGLMLENAKLTGRVLEQEKLNRDLLLAAEVQRRLLPDGVPEMSAGELAAFTLPARSVGGDYYDFLKIGDHGIGIALADVAGKGIPAALIMSVVQASLRILSAEQNITLPELVAKMNRFLHRSTATSSYATFFYAQVDEAKRELRYVNAGHNPPVLIRSNPENAAVEELATGGTIIGMFAQADYQEARVQLQPGDVLIAFTDGVSEALNEADEEFGEPRLREVVKRITHLPVQEMAARISTELKAWIGTAQQHDDLTFLILKVR